MTVTYRGTSPYVLTNQTTSNNVSYLDFWAAPYITINTTDTLYIVERKYQNRPDLLSYDLYKTTGYWWVFAARNSDIIKDPIYDLVAGITIYLPDGKYLPKSGVSGLTGM